METCEDDVILEDFVMLGKTVPEPSRRTGRVFVCSAGVSTELRSLIRIYPLARRDAPPRWSICRVPLERNQDDHRHESFKITGDRQPGAHERINKCFQVLGKVRDTDRAKLLGPYVVGSIDEANHRRLSLAIVYPDGTDLYLKHNPESPESPQLALFDSGDRIQEGAKRFAFTPHLRFRDEAGWHDLSLRDWGCFELMRKRGDAYAQQHMAKALHLDTPVSLLVGNQNHRRTSWLVISVLKGIRKEPTLFEALGSQRPPIPDSLRGEVFERDGWRCRRCGSEENLRVDHIWPYSRGGTDALDNLQTLCDPCNSEKGDSV